MPYRWYVNASSVVTGIAWAACSYLLPSQAATGCVAAALLVGINGVIQAHGGSGSTSAPVDSIAKRDNTELLRMYHYANGTSYDFINTTALTYDWHNVTVPDHHLDLIVRRLPDGRIHARTQGFSTMPCSDSMCPAQKPKFRFMKRATTEDIEDIDFTWTEPDGYGSATQTGVEAAASGAAGYIVNEQQGTTAFCSNAISENGLTADVGINFYGGSYATADPPPCGF